MTLRRVVSALTSRALRAATAMPAALAMACPLCPARFASSDEHIKASAALSPPLAENASPPPIPPLQSFGEIKRLTEAAHRQAVVDDGTDDYEGITARNAVPVAMLRRTVSTELLTARENQATVLRSVEQLCTLSHTNASLEALIEVLLVLNPAMDATYKSDWTTHYEYPHQWECEFPTERGDRFRRRFLLAWCRLRLFDPTLPDTEDEQALRQELRHLLNDGSAPFLSSAVGRDEFFLRMVRRDTHRYGVLHLQFLSCITRDRNLDVFATAEFFDEFFLKFAWNQDVSMHPLCTVIARSSADRCRPLLTPAFRDTYFLRTLDDLRCRDFKGYDIASGRSAFSAIVCCREFTCAAAEKGIRFPCTATLCDFLTSLISKAFETKEYRRDERVGEALCEFEKILRESTDFAVLRTAGFRDSFFLKVADGLQGVRHCPDGCAAFARILAQVTLTALPAEVEVFATEDVRDRLIVPLGLRLTDAAYMHHLNDAAKLRAAFTAAFDAIARTEDGSLKAVFDTEAVRSEVLPRLAVVST